MKKKGGLSGICLNQSVISFTETNEHYCVKDIERRTCSGSITGWSILRFCD